MVNGKSHHMGFASSSLWALNVTEDIKSESEILYKEIKEVRKRKRDTVHQAQRRRHGILAESPCHLAISEG